jgi:hypothetical protein
MKTKATIKTATHNFISDLESRAHENEFTLTDADFKKMREATENSAADIAIPKRLRSI